MWGVVVFCVLDEIWDLIESVSEGFLTYSCCSCWMWKGKVGENGCSVFAGRRPPVWEMLFAWL